MYCKSLVYRGHQPDHERLEDNNHFFEPSGLQSISKKIDPVDEAKRPTKWGLSFDECERLRVIVLNYQHTIKLRLGTTVPQKQPKEVST